MAFHFVPVGAVGQRHAGYERAQRGGEADKRHQRGDAHHQGQGEHGEHFVEADFADEAEHARHQVAHAHGNGQNGGDAHGGEHPAGLVGQKVGGVLAASVVVAGGQERQERQHRDGGHVLKQQDGKACLPAGRLHQIFFAIGLQHDGGGGERQNAAHGHAHLPAFADGYGDAGNRRHGEHHLQSAQPQELVPQLPQLLRRQLQTDQKQHHHHAEFGNVLDGFGFFTGQTQNRADGDTGHQIAQHRAQAQFFGNQYGGHGEGEVGEGVEQDGGHGRILGKWFLK